MKTVLSIIFWILTVFFALAATAFLPSVASIFGFLAAAAALPLFSWQKQLDNFFTLPIRIIVILLFAFLMFYTAPDVGEKNLVDDVEKKLETLKEDDSKDRSADSDEINADASSQTVVVHGVTDTKHQHTFANATCAAPKTCIECSETEGYPIPHEFTEGFCVYCSVSEADAVMVWIPMHGGEKYHSKEDCSNMKDPAYVSIIYAESEDFEACKRCY